MPMTRLPLAALALAAVMLSGCTTGRMGRSATPLAYPQTAAGQQIDTYHGVEVADPFRWLEDPDSPETKAWVEAQNRVTFGYLEEIPARERIKQRLTELWNYERYGIPTKKGSHYFFEKNDGLQNQAVLYVQDDLESPPRMLLDPNTLSSDGTVSVTNWSPSEDGRLLAYSLSSGGSDWQEWRVRDIASGADRPDHLRWVKFSGASWLPDGSGFYYSRYDEPKPGDEMEAQNYYQKLYFHRLGTPQSEDRLIYQRPDQKEWGFSGNVTEDGRYLVISVWKGTERKNLVFYQPLSPETPVVELVKEFQAEFDFIGNDGPVMFFRTDLDAPLGRVVAINVDQPAGGWRQVIPQTADALQGVSLIGGKLVARYLHDAHSLVQIHALDGALVREVPLAGKGSVAGFGGRADDPETFFSYTSFTTPSTIYRYNVDSGAAEVFRKPNVDFNPDDYETKQVFYSSKDGTRVPMFITHRRGLPLDGDNPTFLYGYGGFNISLTPAFRVENLVWMEMGGVYAMPNLRGGGEYGMSWHEGGRKLNKQNVFDDFIAAAEWLIANKYTRPRKLAIHGRSNGGLLVGACMTQRPELFGAALPGVGVLDMLRFHKFTIGWAWTSDYGSPDNPEEFKALLAYSPLHNLRPGTHYPATMITTADHDDRVVPAHSFKFAAALQGAHAGPNPVLIRIETRAGHGAGKPTTKRIEEIADQFAFLVRTLEIEPLPGGLAQGW